MAKDLLFKGDWIDALNPLDAASQKEVLYKILRHGIYGENNVEDLNAAEQVSYKLIADQIDKMQDKYEGAVAIGKKGGRKKITDNDEIYQYAVQGWTAKKIGEKLNINPKTIYSNEGWKRAKQDKNS